MNPLLRKTAAQGHQADLYTALKDFKFEFRN